MKFLQGTNKQKCIYRSRKLTYVHGGSCNCPRTI